MVLGGLLVFCLFMSLFMCVCFYFSLDTVKCSFFLVLSLIFVSPCVSMGVHVWYSYFVCMVLLSGVFVILVYFSSLSSFVYVKKPLGFVFLCGTVLVGKVCFGVPGYTFLGFEEIYFDGGFEVVVYMISNLFFFFMFIGYYLFGESALRAM